MRLHWEYELEASRERLWRYIADTDWINRHAGLPAIAARTTTTASGTTARFASFRYGPVLVEWEELPTVWRAPEFFEVDRRYSHGPLVRFFNRTELVAIDDRRTRVVVDILLQPRSALTRPLLPLLAAQGKRGSDRAFRMAERLARGENLAPNAQRGETPLAILREHGVDVETVAVLDRFLAEADDRELVQIRPFEVADRYGVRRAEMLRAFLTGARRGLFNLRWDVICPSCRGTPNSFEALGDLTGALHCASCNVPYGPQFDRSVEVTFSARPLGRGVDVPLYCVASPQRSPHVLAQTFVPAGSTGEIGCELRAGTYDVNAIGIGLTPFIADADAAPASVDAKVEREHVLFPHQVGSGALRVRIENASGRDVAVRIEDGRWPDTIATAAQVTAMQEFRDLFSSEVLAPGLELGIESLAVLFTDLVGSTAMYTQAGDAPAFKIVTDHFERMRSVIAEHDGAIVKTIGDAVMAVFEDPQKCTRAALALDRSIRDLEHDGKPLRLRVGFHVGPCIAMRANDRIDYFGTTVNLAARLQSKANGGEVALAQQVAAHPGIAAELLSRSRDATRESVDVKGFAQPVAMLRVCAD